jgi:hypothetical protein
MMSWMHTDGYDLTKLEDGKMPEHDNVVVASQNREILTVQLTCT